MPLVIKELDMIVAFLNFVMIFGGENQKLK